MHSLFCPRLSSVIVPTRFDPVRPFVAVGLKFTDRMPLSVLSLECVAKFSCQRPASPLSDSMTSTPASAECILATAAAGADAVGRWKVAKAPAAANSDQRKSYLPSRRVGQLQVCVDPSSPLMYEVIGSIMLHGAYRSPISA